MSDDICFYFNSDERGMPKTVFVYPLLIQLRNHYKIAFSRFLYNTGKIYIDCLRDLRLSVEQRPNSGIPLNLSVQHTAVKIEGFQRSTQMGLHDAEGRWFLGQLYAWP